jgi:AmiR/NasT family two-component response regulator
LATELLQTERRLARALNQVANLEIALASNRDIGTAIGILMKSHLVTQDQAFTMLRTASQHGHRKLRDIANDVIFTGSLGAAKS